MFNKANKNLVLYSSFPKSGSNHIVSLINIGTNGSVRTVIPKISPSYGNNFIDVNKIIGDFRNYFKSILIYGHIPYHSHTDLILKKLNFNGSVLVSIRSLPDVVISYKEHIDKYGGGPLDYRIQGAPECNPSWFIMNDKEKYDYIIKFILPWYVKYSVGWMLAQSNFNIRFVTFEEHTVFPLEFANSFLDFIGICSKNNNLDKSIVFDNIRSNFNVGLTGRGRKLLNSNQIQLIESLFQNFDNNIKQSYLVEYLLYGYDKLPFDVKDVVEGRSKLSFSL